jgi:DNA polymerase-1|tara:strand:+ start:101 stop:910 length:810 start_codon:yes stop_codon:yes gene_type:complete
MNAPDGFPTNAIFGFIKTLNRMRERVQPTHIAVIWDGGLDEERTEALEEYKAERDPMPDDMEVQLDAIVEWLEAVGIYTWCEDGVEADDVIATLAWQAEAAGQSVVVASADKDFFQLINLNIRLLNPNDKSDTLWEAQQVIGKTGVQPPQIVDWLSLVGDAVDGIPGVPGVGPKTASKLLNEYKTIDNIYNNLNAIVSDKLRDKVAKAEMDVRRNQGLVRLKKISQWDVSLAELIPGDLDYKTLNEQYTRWNFRTFLKELDLGRQGELL